jgi:hypothetical protein
MIFGATREPENDMQYNEKHYMRKKNCFGLEMRQIIPASEDIVELRQAPALTFHHTIGG